MTVRHRHRYPSFWTPKRVPLGLVEIDWSHPLSRGLVGAWIWGRSCVDLVSGSQAIISQGTPGIGSGPIGPRFVTTTQFDAFQMLAHGLVGALSNWTVAVDVQNSSVSPVPVFYCERSTSGGNDLLRLSPQGAGNSANTLYRDDAGTLIQQAGSKNISDGNLHNVGFSRSGTTFSLYVDGAADGSGNQTVTNTFTDAGIVTTNGSDPLTPGANETAPGYQSYLYVYNRALAASDIAWLNAEPFAVLRPTGSRIFKAPVASVGGMLDCSATTAIVSM